MTHHRLRRFSHGWLNSGGEVLIPGVSAVGTLKRPSATVPIQSFNLDHAGVFVIVLIAVLAFFILQFHFLALSHLAWPFHFYRLPRPQPRRDCRAVTEYHREGNGFFLFLIVLIVASIAIVALLGGFVFGSLMLWRNYHISNSPALLVLVPIAVFAWVAFAVVVNLILYFMPPVMYTRRCSPGDAARAILRLILDDPVPSFLHSIHARALDRMDHGGLPGHLPDLLSGLVALYWHCHGVACSSFLPLLFASFLAPIWGGLGCEEQDPGSGDDYSARANDRSGASAHQPHQCKKPLRQRQKFRRKSRTRQNARAMSHPSPHRRHERVG